MDRLYKTYGRLLAETDMGFTRYLYDKINWDNRLIVIVTLSTTLSIRPSSYWQCWPKAHITH